MILNFIKNLDYGYPTVFRAIAKEEGLTMSLMSDSESRQGIK